MDHREYAKECGLRLRRVRMAKNLSQQDLADKMFTTPQNVSKWEKEGIRDIDTIKKLSEILGQDLLSDERNEEGLVGEIGKHILKKIAENGGFLPVTDLIEEHMFGLKSAIVTEEIFKLEKIGMCVREQYKNFYDIAKDMLFITAKGVITLNNLLVFGSIQCKTYEQFLENRNTIQEYYDENSVEKLVRNLHYCGTYRIDYINHLHKKYEKIYIDEHENDGCFYGDWKASIPLLPGKSLRFDLLSRMISGLNDKKLSNLMEYFLNEDAEYGSPYFKEEVFWKAEEHEWLEYKYGEVEIPHTDEILGKNSELIRDWNDKVKKDRNLIRQEILDGPLDEEKQRYLSLVEEDTEEYKFFYEEDIDYFINQANAFVEGKFPSEWFSLDEIIAFIKENFRGAETAEEKEIDSILAEINKLDPNSLKYYDCDTIDIDDSCSMWVFLDNEWREAGIEKLIKSFYKLNTDNDSEVNEE